MGLSELKQAVEQLSVKERKELLASLWLDYRGGHTATALPGPSEKPEQWVRLAEVRDRLLRP